jgi:hypothetical protein
MKKMMMMALAAIAALGLVSCAKENGSQNADGKTNVLVKISNQPMGTRAIAAGVSAGYKTTLADGMVLIFRDGNLVDDVVLDVTLAETTGQVIEGVPSTAEVFVVGNIDESAVTLDLSTVTTWADFEALFASVTTQQDASKVVLANTGNAPKAIESVDLTAGTAEVHVNLAPVVSRLQLAKVTGKTEDGATDLVYSVEGVYVGNYYENFTYVGSYSGTTPFKAFADGVNHGGLAIYRDEAQVLATAGVAQTASKVWGYNVVANNVPYLIVKVKLLMPYTIDGVSHASGKELFLTVGSYKKTDGTKIDTFAPGTIYNIANLSFNAGQLTEEPVENVALTLTVEVDEWAYVEVDGVIL